MSTVKNINYLNQIFGKEKYNSYFTKQYQNHVKELLVSDIVDTNLTVGLDDKRNVVFEYMSESMDFFMELHFLRKSPIRYILTMVESKGKRKDTIEVQTTDLNVIYQQLELHKDKLLE
ncbi:MAG: hypothetical protein AAF378_10620 [Cyanobacteria bacterium P01_A01_bin.84]